MYDPRNFILSNMNLLVPRMLYTNLNCNPASGSSEEVFLRYSKLPLLKTLTGTPKMANLFIFTNLNPHSLKMIPTKFGLEKKSFKGKLY